MEQELLRQEYPELEKQLRELKLQEVDELPSAVFGSLGEAIIWFSDEQFLLVLPTLLKRAIESDEPGYARLAVQKTEDKLSNSAYWSRIHQKLTSEATQALAILCEHCCRLGWDDDKRYWRHRARCEGLFLTDPPVMDS